jgi:Flp pilus assembly protein TadG
MEDGQNTVEFALVTVMFILLLLSVVEMGRMMLVFTTMANAAKAGTRYAIVHGGERTGSGSTGPSGPGNPCTCSEVKTIVKDFASAGLIDSSKLVVTVAYPGGKNTAGSIVTVTVSYPYDPLVSYFKSALGATLGSTSQGVISF